MNRITSATLVLTIVSLLAFPALAQSVYQETYGKVAVGVKFSTLGAGIELATPVTHRSNLRFGFDAFTYSRSLDKDNLHYDAQLGFRTLEAHYDFFPWAGGFYLSPGLVAYLTSPITADASVPAGQRFTLGGASFVSDPANPVKGTGKLDFNRAGPSFTVGWGNLLPRSAKRFTVPVEVGIVYQGAPKATLNLGGNVCDFALLNCPSVATPTVFSHVRSEERKIENDTNFFQVYPIISVGLAWKF